MKSTPEKKNEGINRALPDLSSFITGWSQSVASFHHQFKLLAGAIDTIERQASAEISTDARQELNTLKKSRAESIQVLRQLLVDMDGGCGPDQVLPPVPIERLHAHTVQLQKQIKRIQRVLGLHKFQVIHTTAWA